MRQTVGQSGQIYQIFAESEHFPKRLLEIPGVPKSLYVIGALPQDDLPSVAIIGARDCTEYGKHVARHLGQRMAQAGVQVISGMARGIDGISQMAALESKGMSFGVLGCGVDICYPSQNRPLYDLLVQKGGILSEYPPGTAPKANLFPPRNRIVSGLSDVVIVVEAREKSGTLITVDMALEQGRDVYVVPGRITDPLSVGCNRLAKCGAGLFLDADDLLEELWEIHDKKTIKQPKNTRLQEATRVVTACTKEGTKMLFLKPEEEAIWQVLDYYPQSVDEIQKKLPESFRELPVRTILMRMCMEKHAVCVSSGFFCIPGEA